jgi:NitT/TauT family transport system substrate-binding protein
MTSCLFKRRAAALGAFAALVLGVAGCGSSSSSSASSSSSGNTSSASSAQPAAATTVSVMADYFLAFYHSAFFIATHNGWYKDSGLNVNFLTGTGSDNTVTQVGAGRETFGLATSDAVARGVGHGESVKTVAQLQVNSGFCAVVPVSTGITSFRQLAGKSYAAAAGGGPALLLPVVEKYNGMPAGSIKLITPTYTAILPGYLKRTFFAAGDLDYGIPIFAGHDHLPSRCLSYASNGAPVLGLGLIASDSEIADHPDTVRAFVQATIRGWNYAFAHPTQALSIMESMATKTELEALFPNPISLASFAVMKSNLVGQTPGTKGTPLGCSSAAEWEAMEKTLAAVGNIPKAVPVSQLYTNQFVGDCP